MNKYKKLGSRIYKHWSHGQLQKALHKISERTLSISAASVSYKISMRRCTTVFMDFMKHWRFDRRVGLYFH